MGDRKELRPRGQRLKETYRRSCPKGNLVEVLGREVRQGSPGGLMVESSPSRQRRPPGKKNKEMSDEAADAAALTYLLTYLLTSCFQECANRLVR